MGWAGEQFDRLQDAAKIIVTAPKHSLSWYRAVEQWNDTCSELSGTGYEDLVDNFEITNADYVDESDLPGKYTTEADRKMLKCPNFNPLQILTLSE